MTTSPPERTQAPAAPPRLVLDTQVVLDWLWFQDHSTLALNDALRSQALTWQACGFMLEELISVLDRPRFADHTNAQARRGHTLQTWQELAHMVEPGPTLAGLPGLRCRDPDDQGFLDLAVHQNCRWLLSKDRALLALKRPAARLGVEVLTPEEWTRSRRLQLKR